MTTDSPDPLRRPDSPRLPPPLPAPALFSPVSEQSRHRLVDALRGFAIFGILLVNMAGFKAPMLASAGTGERWLEGGANAATLLIIEVLASGKFVAMFALLFGMGMVMQERKARAAGRGFTAFFLRRMFVLLVLGAAHGVLLWAGDILAVYAVFGMIGLLFLRCRIKTLFVWSAFLFGSLLAMFMGLGALTAFEDGSGSVWWINMGEWWVASYQAGSFGEIVLARSAEWALMWGVGFFTYFPYAFSLFLLGMALGKMDILAKLDGCQPKLRLFIALALPAGLAASLLYAAFIRGTIGSDPGAFAIGMAGYLIGMGLLAFVYAASFSLFVQRGLAPAFIDRLAAVGRLALTNYLMHSIIANILFMSWGFALYGKVEAQTGVVIALTVFLFQLLLSPVWLRYFEIGPFEWAWRALSYGSAPRLRRRIHVDGS
jgi:uncharacterized protein